MIGNLLQGSVFFLVLIGLAIPLGWYIKEILQGNIPKYMRFLQPVERFFYRIIGPASRHTMKAKQYLVSILMVSLFSLLALLLILMTQGWLPLNGNGAENLSFPLAVNIAVSFITNTNWQAYAGEEMLSNFSQIFGLTVQNFLSAAIGIAVLSVLIRGLIQRQQKFIGNFWQDIVRSLVYLLLPLATIVAILLMSQGVVQTFSSGFNYEGLNGESLWLALGTVASQVAIKQLGTNGGGFYGANSAYPFENPNLLTNFIENISILLIPMALIFAFGFWVKEWQQGRTIFIVSLSFILLAVVGVLISETYGPQFADVLGQANLEGKEMRFGVGWSSIWAVSTTAAANGSVNAMMDSFTPFGGLIPMFLMQLGEIIFGGAGSGLYGMLAFILLAVFVAGLLVGRTPEYLGKKIEVFDMKMASLVILTPLLLTLFGGMLLVLHPDIFSWLKNSGPHAFTEVLYNATSLANNNGSAFSGMTADTTFLNLLGSGMMLLSRFMPMAAILFLGQNLSQKKIAAVSEGTLSTTNATFVVMLMIVIVVIGALSFLPAMALGPIAEFFTN
ncbi:potassium-transporting ATPase subunit KdpA [Enterococcus sp. HY326]|uniref:potassium-transporting ATPase subunit KdpA n=1 Tax=Enterococcus sp. HY326 TaxID=2971265 RepID=UPI00223FF80A|nr:potassium-transporting ATPase subunit KdpA [Enterococcus sp. HY326]